MDAKKFRNKSYYHIAHHGSSDTTHPAIKRLKEEIKGAKSVLDMGCGEGTRLDALIGKGQKGVGVDLSVLAIKMAKKQYPNLSFKVANLEKLPFRGSSFDLVFSAFVFEHLDNPERVIKEAIRVVKKGGGVVIIAPNFGAPNRRSPNSREDKIEKLTAGFKKDFRLLSNLSLSSLGWKKVKPQRETYEIDADTTVEPYLNSLVKYVQSLGMEVNFYSSFWQMDRFSPFQLPFRTLSFLGVYPYYFWGPHLCIIFRKI